MPLPSKQHVASVPLFERLSDRNPEQPREPVPLRTLSFPDLLVSVQDEIARLLNTRTGLSSHELLERERSVINFGASDLLWVNPYDPQSMRHLVQMLTQTVEAFEPRLMHPRVTVVQFVQTESRLILNISGTLITQDLREPVSFRVMASPRLLEHRSHEQ
ncbi:MAG: type VI secretion system baseplate subunit TssE [Myxococcales bacterium]|nr:type VI secretion system baseplate subunit TssE [Myxococcales bacterium]